MGAIHAFRGKGAVSTVWIVAAGLPHSQQHPRPQRCSRKSLRWTQPAKGKFSRWWAWLHFFILRTRCVVLRLVAVGIHNEFTYLVHGQQTSPFSTRRQTMLHFENKQKQPPPYTANSQLFSNDYLQASEWKSCLSLLQPLCGCYLNPKGFMT